MAEATNSSEPTYKISHAHIECPICFDRFTDPKILDCLHSFCLKCLVELADNQDPKTDIILCPVCRRETPVPDAGLADLANSFFLSSLVDDVNKQEKLRGDRQLIASCERSEGKTRKCRKHTNQEVCFYCESCEVLACGKCAVLDHRSAKHELSEIEDSVRSYRKNVQEAFHKFGECRKRFHEVDDSIENSQNRLRLMVDRACRDIMAKEEEKISKIRSASRLLQQKITHFGKERGVKFDRILSQNRNKMNQADQIIDSVTDSMQQADNFELLDLKPKIMQNLTFHKKLKFESVQHSQSFIGFKCNDVVNDEHLGEILYKENWELKTSIGKEGEGDGEFKFASDVACFSNGDIAVTNTRSKQLLSFTFAGCYKSTGVQSESDEGKLRGPRRVAVTSDDLLLVTDGQNVKMYDSNFQFIRQFRPSPDGTVGKLRGIAVDKKNQIVVADIGNKVISFHNPDGSMTSAVSHEMIGEPCNLSIGTKDRVLFTHYEERKLVCVDFTGNEVFSISTSINGKPVKPTGVCCDDAGDIYVSVHDSDQQGSFKVLHYDPEGVHIGCIAHGLYNPLGLTFTHVGDLAVADMHSVKIFHRV